MKNMMVVFMLTLLSILMFEQHQSRKYIESLYARSIMMRLEMDALHSIVEWHQEQLSGDAEIEERKDMVSF